jgi:hypothetical protein
MPVCVRRVAAEPPDAGKVELRAQAEAVSEANAP